jgi:hypothetical protein
MICLCAQRVQTSSYKFNIDLGISQQVAQRCQAAQLRSLEGEIPLQVLGFILKGVLSVCSAGSLPAATMCTDQRQLLGLSQTSRQGETSPAIMP